ncbi:Glutamine--fructose-6-phosphate aminotransferase [isomerizing], partial [Geodia barretti]
VCGIVAYVGQDEAWPIIYEELKRLEYRGYDSAGIAVVDDTGALHLRKTVGKVSGLAVEINGSAPRGSLGLGHTRWATHGAPSHDNAHPHIDCSSRVALVHNGIVENYLELKRRLTASGHIFKSETDTEALSHLVEEGMSLGLSFEESFRRMGRLVQGSSAITATLDGEDGPICAMRLGFAGGIGIVASDLPALLPVLERGAGAPNVGFLEGGEMAIVSREGVRYSDLSGNPVVKETRRVSREDIVVDKGGHRHFMLKEIMDQPQAMTAALKDRADFANGRVNLPEFPLSPADVMQLERVVLIGCGTSLHAAQVGRHYIERLAGIPAEAESASEFRYRDPIIGPRTLVVSIGQSGETADTVAAMHLAREKGATLITICNAEESQAARVADGALYMHAGLEVGVASTKTFVASLTILQLLSVYLGQLRGKLDAETTRRLVDQMARGPGLIGEVLAEANLYSSLARRIGHYDNFLFLGRGANAAIASEGALKLKEISYIHAEGYPAGEMKHGPIALIDPEMCTVALAPRDDLRDKTLSNIKEVKARGGLVVAVLTKGDDEAASEVDFPLFIPQAPDLLMPLVTTVPLQLLSYYIALLRGCDVDQPRNLAKSVTVE